MKTTRFLLRGFRRPRKIACFALGKLERQVLEELLSEGVRDIYRALTRNCLYDFDDNARQTLQKSLLERRKDGRRLSMPLCFLADLDQDQRRRDRRTVRTWGRCRRASSRLHCRYNQRERSRATRRTRSPGAREEERAGTKELVHV